MEYLSKYILPSLTYKDMIIYKIYDLIIDDIYDDYMKYYNEFKSCNDMILKDEWNKLYNIITNIDKKYQEKINNKIKIMIDELINKYNINKHHYYDFGEIKFNDTKQNNEVINKIYKLEQIEIILLNFNEYLEMNKLNRLLNDMIEFKLINNDILKSIKELIYNIV